MKKYACYLFIPFIFLLLRPLPAQARSYHFPSVRIEAEVLQDGSLQITEQRTAAFSGTYRGMWLWLQTQQPIRVSDVSVAENGVPYQFTPGNSPGPAGTYYTVEEADRFLVDWSFEATDEIRMFTIRYRIQDVVMAHQDIAELYYQFIGQEWETHADRVTVHLRLPQGAAPEDIRAWGHGPLHGSVVIDDAGNITWEITPLPARTFLEGRVTFPLSLVPAATHRTGRAALQGILQEEQKLAAQANRERRSSAVLWTASAIVLAGSLALAFLLWLRYGKEFTPSFDGEYYRELPADYTPAELGVLWRFGKPAAEDLTATLVDLARKGELRLEEYVPEKRGLFRSKKQDYRVIRTGQNSTLAGHEEKLLHFLFSQVAPGKNELTFDELERYAKNHPARFQGFWQDWQSTLAARGEILGFFDHDVNTGKAFGVGLGVVMLPLAFWVANTLTPALLLGGIILTVTGLFLRRRSRGGVEDFVRWRAFRRFLLHFSEMQRHEIPSLAIWEHYLVYAISLGVAKEVIKQLQLVFPQMESGGHRFGGMWYLHSGRGPASLTAMTTSFDSMTSQITQSLRTATSPQSSGSGRGGGFSGGGGFGGGGGGFGGGGGGAR